MGHRRPALSAPDPDRRGLARPAVLAAAARLCRHHRRPRTALPPYADRPRLPGDRRGQLCRARHGTARAAAAHGELRPGRRDREPGGLHRRRDASRLLRQPVDPELLRLRAGGAGRHGLQPRRRDRRPGARASSSRRRTSWSAASSRPSPCSSSSSSCCCCGPKALPARPPRAACDGRERSPHSGSRGRPQPVRQDRGRAALGSPGRRRRRPAAARRFLFRRDRPARLHLLDPGRRPEPRGGLRRPDRHRLGGAADPGRLHHRRADRRHRDDGVESLPGSGRERRRRRGLRRGRRPAGAPAAHLLLRHDDAGLRHHRHPGGAGLEERDRRRHRHAGPGVSLAVRPGLGLLLSLSHPGGARHLDDGQHRQEPLRPRAGGHPRRRGGGRSLGHRQARASDGGVRVQRRAGRRGGRPVLLAAILHHARRLHLRPVGAVLHRHPDRRARLDHGAAARHHHPDGAAGVRGARWSPGRRFSTPRSCS